MTLNDLCAATCASFLRELRQPCGPRCGVGLAGFDRDVEDDL